MKLSVGDIVVFEGVTHDPELLGAQGVVVTPGQSEDYVGVKLEKKLLKCSSSPEILYGPVKNWHRYQPVGGSA